MEGEDEKNKLKDTRTNIDGTFQMGTRYCFESNAISENVWGAFVGELRP